MTCDDEGSLTITRSQRGAIALMAIFFIGLLPIVVNGYRYFGDEHFYTDAAIRMVQTGDYITPYTEDGKLRFDKPILAYWAIAASYKAFGISFFSSRLPFLLAGCALIWLVHRLSLEVSRQPESALIAAGMMVANFTLFSSAVRTTPDMFQCLFITLSLYGFMRIILNHERTTWTCLLAYVGAGLAVMAKGIPGTFPVIFAFVFCFVRRKHGARVRDLIHWETMLLGAAIALSWFVAAYIAHGNDLIKGFFNDQITENIGQPKTPKGGIPSNIAYYVWSTTSHFLPWSAFLLLSLAIDFKKLREFSRAHKEILWFVAGWYLILFAIFASAKLTRGRYLFPAYPLLAVLFSAALMHAINTGQVGRWLRVLMKAILIAGFAVGTTMAIVGGFVDRTILTGGLVLTASVLIALILAWRNSLPIGLASLGVSVFLVLAAYDVCVRPVFAPDVTRSITRALLPLNHGSLKIAAVESPSIHASNRIRIWSGGRVHIDSLEDDASPADLARYEVLIVSDLFLKSWNSDGYRLVECACTYKNLKPSDIRALLHGGSRSDVWERRKFRYYLAFKSPPQFAQVFLAGVPCPDVPSVSR